MNYSFTFKKKVDAEIFSYYILQCNNATLNRREPEYDSMLDIWIVDVVLTCESCIGGKCK